MRALASVALLLAGGALAAPERLTSGGCCTEPFWAPDSRRVLFIDRPKGAAAAGIYSVDADAGPGQAPRLAFSRIAYYAPSLAYAAVPASGGLTVERLSDRARFTVPGATSLAWSPDGRSVAWSVSDQSGTFDTRRSRVYAAPFGGPARLVATVYGGGVAGWLGPDELLLTGKSAPSQPDRALRAVRVSSGAGRVLAQAANLRGVSISRGGRFVAYYVAFDRPERNGLFVLAAAGGKPRKLGTFGSYRWRSADALALIPLRPGARSHVVLNVDAATGKARQVLDLGGKVKDDGWQVSPDGSRLVFVNARDRNLYVVALPR